MSKDIRQFLHYYLGCDVRTNDHDMGDDNKHYGRVGTFIGFVDHTRLSCRLAHRAGPEGRVSVFMLKPILRPLSDMTEDEMIGLLQSMVPADMEDKPKDEDYDLEMFYNDGATMVDGDVAVGANMTCICYEGQIAVRESGDIDMFDENGDPEKVINQSAAFHYLLSKYFDLFGLIEDGVALDKTKHSI